MMDIYTLLGDPALKMAAIEKGRIEEIYRKKRR